MGNNYRISSVFHQVAQNYKTFKLSGVEDLVECAIQSTTADRWKSCVDKVVRDVEQSYWKKDGLNRTDPIEPIVIHLGDSDSDSDSDEEDIDWE